MKQQRKRSSGKVSTTQHVFGAHEIMPFPNGLQSATSDRKFSFTYAKTIMVWVLCNLIGVLYFINGAST